MVRFPTAIPSRTRTIGPRITAEYLLAIASVKNTVSPAMFPWVGRRRVRQRK
jgi:hypothetical protein